MISPNLFFSHFQINYFDYKQGSLNYLLENYSKVGLDKSIIGYKEKDYITAIKSDIRQTYFQSIETMFEIFFALLPDKKGKINNRVIERITLSDLPYSNIRKIAENEDSLDFLDTKLTYTDNSKVSLGEYIFFFGLHKFGMKAEFSEAIESIKYLIKILAKEFSDRREYNSYKHGLRILPALQKLAMCDPETMEEQFSWSLDNSMTFYSYDKKTEETFYTTKVFDSKRDIRMTSLCSYLIWNMINFRDLAFNKDKKDKKDKNTQFTIQILTKEEIDRATETDVKIQNLEYSIKPIKN